MRALMTTAAPPGAAAEPHVLRGELLQAIADFAREAALDPLMIGAVGRTVLAGLVLGNTAEEILQLADCSILALEPHGALAPDS